MFRGSQAASGSYEQCLDTEKTDYEGKVSIRGQYCTLFLPPSKKMFLHAKGIIGNDPLYKVNNVLDQTMSEHRELYDPLSKE